MSDWSDLYDSSAQLKKRSDAVMENGVPSAALGEEGDPFDCRLIPLGSELGDSGAVETFECYWDVGPNVAPQDVLEIDGHDYLVRGLNRNIANADEVAQATLVRWIYNADLS